jgi:hypothetical protein
MKIIQIDIYKSGESSVFKRVVLKHHILKPDNIEQFRKNIVKKYKSKVEVFFTFKSKHLKA